VKILRQFVAIGGYKPDKDSLAQAKGKNGKSFSNEFFASADDFLNEFGLIGKPAKKSQQ
jgi:hypothetical protein